MSKKALKTLEKEYGIMMKGNVDLDERFDDEEFKAILAEKGHTYVGMNHEGRTEFLKENGYKITRENMLNADLAPKPPESDNSNSADEQNEVG